MKKQWTTIIASIIVATVFVTAVNPSLAQGRRGPIVLGAINTTDMETLQFMREEEQLARDVYIAMYQKWQNPVFANIAKSEQRHMDAIKSRLDAYGLSDFVQDTGVFTNSELQGLYNSLVEQGSVSALAALKVGALIEEVDIEDLNNAIAATTLADLRRVYQNLKAGSENHLRAFVRSMEAAGESYTPQVLSSEELQAILSATNAQGQGRGGNGQGRGNGNGCGNGNGRGRGGQGNGGNRNGTCGAQNSNFIDANGDGVCDRMATGACTGQQARQGRNGN